MNDIEINEVAKNIVFNDIEMNAMSWYKSKYNESPLELIFADKNGKKEDTLLQPLTLGVFSESIIFHYCFYNLTKFKYNFQRIFTNVLTLNDPDRINKANIEIIEVSKYIDYLFYYKDIFDPTLLNDFFESGASYDIKDLNGHGFFDVSDLFLFSVYLKYGEISISSKYYDFLLSMIVKISDIKCSFKKKWEKFFYGYNEFLNTFSFTPVSSDLIFKISKCYFNFFWKLLSLEKKQNLFLKYFIEAERIYPQSTNTGLIKGVDNIIKNFNKTFVSYNAISKHAKQLHKNYLNKVNKFINTLESYKNYDEILNNFKKNGQILNFIIFSDSYRNQFLKVFKNYRKNYS